MRGQRGCRELSWVGWEPVQHLLGWWHHFKADGWWLRRNLWTEGGGAQGANAK